jgi:NitT/TauT family transport system substrate-binding protein
MAKLTPLAKGLLSLSILAVVSAAAWHLGIKDLLQDNGTTATTKGEKKPGILDKLMPGKKASGALGSATNPLKVSIVSFHGYAPAIMANGNSLKTQPGSAFDKNGVNVEFVIQDDIPPLATIFGSDTAHCSWRTSDFWAQEHPNLRNAKYDAKAIMVVDNTQGADAVIARDPSVQRIEDLAGRKIAMLQYTPSHGMVTDAIENSSLSKRKQKSIDQIYINVEEGTAGVRAALQAGQVDAAALWDPDLALALQNVPGAHVIYSTKTATNLIYDVIVCDNRHLNDPANESAYQAFVSGWIDGVDLAERNPAGAVDALIQTQEFFSLLAKDEGKAFVRKLFDNLVWTDLEDNVRILGLAGGTNHYERVYKRFDGLYRREGALANPNSPIINPSASFDYRFIKNLLAKNAAVKVAAAKPEFDFDKTAHDRVNKKPAVLTKPVRVNFKTGTAKLSKRAQKVIDNEMVPIIENNGAAYFEVSGNTDSTGGRGSNMRLSKQRASAVTQYLVSEWEFDTDRFIVVGNGPDKPICNERNPSKDGVKDIDKCRGLNRATRLAVLGR